MVPSVRVAEWGPREAMPCLTRVRWSGVGVRGMGMGVGASKDVGASMGVGMGAGMGAG